MGENTFTFCDLAVFRVCHVSFEKRQLGKDTDFPGEPADLLSVSGLSGCAV